MTEGTDEDDDGFSKVRNWQLSQPEAFGSNLKACCRLEETVSEI